MNTDIIKCPVCGNALADCGSSYKCKNNHCFDKNKKGSVNLLLKGGDHGDDRGMLASRRDFLSAGYYAPVADVLCQKAAQQGGNILDMGCGEGYYSFALAGIQETCVYAFDISKYAASMTAGRDKRVTAFAASSYDIPVMSQSVDVAISVFAPFDPAEAARVLKPCGLLITAYPLPKHLLELKQAVYDDVLLNPDNIPQYNGFEVQDVTEVCFNMHISENKHIKALFDMTPYAYKTPKSLMARLDGLDKLYCRAEIAVATYKKVKNK